MRKGLHPGNTMLESLEVTRPLGEPLDKTAAQPQTSTEALWGILRQKLPADLYPDSWVTEMEKTWLLFEAN